MTNHASARRLEEEPRTAFGESRVLLAQLCEHIERRHVFGVVVQNALQTRHMGDRAQRSPAQLSHAFRDKVRRRVELVGLLIEKQVIVAEVRSLDMPMEVLRLEIQREEIGKERIECAGDIQVRLRSQARRGAQRVTGALHL